MTTLLLLLGGLLVLVGLAGTILPALPGTPLVFVGLLVAAWAEGFEKVGWIILTILALLTLLSFAIEIMATSLGAKRVGASWKAMLGAGIGTIVGLFFGIPGLLLGPFVGAVLGEYIALRDWGQAGKVGFGTWLGLLFGTAAKIALSFAMVGIFVAAYVL
ncbi:MAG TPA: DUF456 domain-containing protein [Thermoanaerobaculia bacterium]|nr:DUF456 domain-containing protein [Thermoanaerobaculia bacterium]